MSKPIAVGTRVFVPCCGEYGEVIEHFADPFGKGWYKIKVEPDGDTTVQHGFVIENCMDRMNSNAT